MNLDEVVRNFEETEPVSSEETNVEETNVETSIIETVPKETPAIMENQLSFTMIPILSWFENYMSEANDESDPRIVKMNTRGVDPTSTVIFTIPAEGTYNENPARKLVLIHPAERFMVPNLKAKITFLQSSVMFDYDVNENMKIRFYMAKKTMLQCYLLCNSDHGFVPYSYSEIAVNAQNMSISYHNADVASINNKCGEAVNKDEVQIYYRQIQKHIAKINSIGETIDWLLTKQSGVVDINHHMEIEKVILDIL